ncbi:site-specific recombinase XerD [Tamaricihabitans halophyticus]|uniref:Site-specific recombinase XerD n=1 Tax=Tamaricihabitans halophyticus TaxID=1262583 RepID=A0A4R2R052_9PSEU|nr:site-specific recombinase XerD [Tamaricihabitans halophyticus]
MKRAYARLMAGKRHRQRGHIEERRGGSLRVHVYAGVDAFTGEERYLRETIPDGPTKWDQAEAARVRLLNDVYEQRHPRTDATVQQLLDKHLPLMDIAETTRRTYARYVKNHVTQLIGQRKIGDLLDATLLDSYYAELARCRDHCTGSHTEHHTTKARECDKRCQPHMREPLAAWTVRKIHFILSGAYARAVRWGWIGRNPMDQAEPPSAPKPNPDPPSAEEAAAILNEAWKDLDFGTLVWVVMITAPRRGEISRLRWRHFNKKRKVLRYSGSIAQDGAEIWEKETKEGEGRNLALDDTTVAVLSDYYDHCVKLASQAGLAITSDAHIFSLTPDGSTPYKPASLGQRYKRLAGRLGINTSIHKLRHYSATELIAAGVDIRTVAGRLGHSGGGTTTLKVYAAWVTEADQRASQTLLSRVPERPAAPPDPIERAKADPQAPYEHIAASLRRAILEGLLPGGQLAPSVKQLCQDHSVSAGTAHRALGLLRKWGLLSDAGRGNRPTIIRPPEPVTTEQPAAELPTTTTTPESTSDAKATIMLDLGLYRLGNEIRSFSAQADPTNAEHLRRLLAGAIRRFGGENTDIDDYALEVRRAGTPELLTTFVSL